MTWSIRAAGLDSWSTVESFSRVVETMVMGGRSGAGQYVGRRVRHT